MKAVVAAFNQEEALVGAFSVITNLRMELFQALNITVAVKVLYGTADGKIGLMTLGRAGPEAGWVMESERSGAGVQCLDNHDVTGDGVRDLIVARHDGTIEVQTCQ